MAIDKTISINAETKQAQKQFEDLTKIIDEQKKITLELKREQYELEEQLKNTPKNALSEQKRLKDELERVTSALKDQSL